MAKRSEDMKQRVNRCMIKLSDRDTESMAINELESLAKTLTPEALPPFLSAISDTRPSDKTPLRRHSLRLISLLSTSHSPDFLLPHFPRMLNAALRRIRDSDSSVRVACVDAVKSMAAAHPASVSSVLLKPLVDALLHEQDLSAQMASALCLAAAVDAAAGDRDLVREIQRLVPKLVKLVRSNAFKAKPALISCIGSVGGAGGASGEGLLGVMVPCLVEFLGSEDWAARKAAAEALSRVGVAERRLLAGFKGSCVSQFEARRFDKVKIVRDSMNRLLEVWKDVCEPAVVDDNESHALVSSRTPSNSSRREIAGDGRYQTASFSSTPDQSASPVVATRKSRISVSRLPPANTTTRRNSTPSSVKKSHPPPSCKTNHNKNSDWKVQISSPQTPPYTFVRGEDILKSKERSAIVKEEGAGESNARSKLEPRRMLFDKNYEDKPSKMGAVKSASRVVPFEESGSSELITGADNGINEIHEGSRDNDLSLIRSQLVQIENQQSSLLDLLQRFIGSSQNGIHCLETRVHGLEIALDEISRDIAVSTGRVSNNDPVVKTCCSLPGAEFLSSKFWRRNEGGRYSLPANPTLASLQFLGEKQGEECRKQRFGLQSGFVNPLAEINSQSRGNTEVAPNKMLKSLISDTRVKHAHNG